MFKLIKLQSPKLASLEVCEIIVCFGLPRRLRLVQCNLVILANPMRIKKLHSFNFIITLILIYHILSSPRAILCNARGYVLFFFVFVFTLSLNQILGKIWRQFWKKSYFFSFLHRSLNVSTIQYCHFNLLETCGISGKNKKNTPLAHTSTVFSH